MNEAKFSKGPWEVCSDDWNLGERPDDAMFSIVSEDKEWHIATVLDAEGAEANAHLIAAAPEMYAFLEQLANEFQVVSCSDSARTGEWFDKRIRRIERKLAKARGES